MFEHDVFISFARENVDVAKDVALLLQNHALRVRFHPDGIGIGKNLHDTLKQDFAISQDLVVIASAAAEYSTELKWEVDTFSKLADGVRRRIFRLKVGRGANNHLPTEEVYADTPEQLVQHIVSTNIERYRLSSNQLREAFSHYTHGRFWRPFVETGLEESSVHIFTCARDSRRGEVRRGQGGRTNIDKWDYTTVLDITHFLRGRYPSTDVTIEEPLSKLRSEDLTGPKAANHIADLRDRVRNRNCIIVGSPDVSDFAEILLARAHNIDPYDSVRSTKQTGFMLQKQATNDAVPMSSHYQRSKSGEEGVAKVGSDKLYRAELNDQEHSGVMYGVLAVLGNPHCDRGQPTRRVIILSGLSGIATNGIAKFLTDDRYLDEFYKFDRDYVDMSRDVEAVIGTRFEYDPQELNERDTRRLAGSKNEIWYEELVELPGRRQRQ